MKPTPARSSHEPRDSLHAAIPLPAAPLRAARSDRNHAVSRTVGCGAVARQARPRRRLPMRVSADPCRPRRRRRTTGSHQDPGPPVAGHEPRSHRPAAA
jgi:hypothetical protein